MPWNPDLYNRFKDLRDRPFYDLADLIVTVKGMKALDLGCGTGSQTAVLADRFGDSVFMGVDASAEMLAKADVLAHSRLSFQRLEIQELLGSNEKFDLIFSNAALQWLDGHELLFRDLIGMLNPGGQFAVQMPVQKENVLNVLLLELVQQEPFSAWLDGWYRPSPVLSMDDYAQVMFAAGLENLVVMTKVYPIIANDHETLYDFIASSALIPYMERLAAPQQLELTQAFKYRIAERFVELPAIYAFKRLLLYGRKPV